MTFGVLCSSKSPFFLKWKHQSLLNKIPLKMNVLGCSPDGYISHSMINTHQGFAVTFPVSNILSSCHQKCTHSWQTVSQFFIWKMWSLNSYVAKQDFLGSYCLKVKIGLSFVKHPPCVEWLMSYIHYLLNAGRQVQLFPFYSLWSREA